MAMPLILATVLLGAPAPEDSIAPVDIVPPSLGPTPPPVPEPTVPEPMVSEPPELALPVAAAPQEPPPSGNGRLAAGFVTLGFGITTLCTALEGAQRKDDPSNPTPRTTGLVIVGLLGVGTGSAL